MSIILFLFNQNNNSNNSKLLTDIIQLSSILHHRAVTVFPDLADDMVAVKGSKMAETAQK